VLSMKGLSPGRADYYVEQVTAGMDEYYTGDQAEPGRWAGSAAARLGLQGLVTAEAFRRLLDAEHPGTGEPLGIPRTTAARVGGFDLCFSAPKSVSLAWALGGPELSAAVASAHDRAVEQAISAIEQEALRARRGAGGQRSVDTEGLVAAAFAHRSSRAGDPQVHTHVVVANLTPDEHGQWSALDSKRLFRWAKTVGYLYQAALRHELSEDLGLAWGPVQKGAADISGVPRDALEAFSTRRAEIEAALAERGPWSKAAAELANLSTRGPKAAVPALDELRERWRAQATELGLGPSFVAGVTHQKPHPVPDLSLLADELLSPEGLTAHASTFDRRAVLQQLSAAHTAGATITALRAAADELLAQPEVVWLGPGTSGEQIYTTAELLATERALVARAEGQLATSLTTVPAGLVQQVTDARPTLSDEQRHMVTALVTSGAPTQVVVGRAGAGKTYALDGARAAWELAGHRVIGTALAARAAAELQAGAGIPSTTLDRLLADLDAPGPMSGLAPRTAIVVDEAGMVETRKLARLLAHAEHWQAQVVLVGDPHQLPEVGAGGAFRALVERLPVLELVDNRRQAEAWERDALAELRSGSVGTAISAYERAGRVTLAQGPDGAREALVEAWWASRQRGEMAMMYALRRADVEDLNRRGRARMERAGLLGTERLVVGDLEFASGDQVMCLRNDRRLGVANGTIGTVTSVAVGEVVLVDGTRLPARYLEAGHLTHALASTVHKAQGATVERAFLLGSDQLYREAGYVGLSRARLSSELFVVAPEDQREMDNPLGHVVRDLQTSRAQSLAMAQGDRGLNAEGRGDVDVARDLAKRALLADPPAWATEALGPVPLLRAERERWAERAAHLSSYREAYGITGPDDALGPRPADATQRRAWEIAQLAVLEDQRSLDIERGLAI
jgi:conjugative relaxase-like TrwC/TraI family protein